MTGSDINRPLFHKLATENMGLLEPMMAIAGALDETTQRQIIKDKRAELRQKLVAEKNDAEKHRLGRKLKRQERITKLEKDEYADIGREADEWLVTTKGQTKLKAGQQLWRDLAESSRWGDLATWAVWSENLAPADVPEGNVAAYQGRGPQADVGSELLDAQYDRIGSVVHSRVIVLAVNHAGEPGIEPYGGDAPTWHNFHGTTPFFGTGDRPVPRFVLPRLFAGTPIEGAYMTDSFKLLPSWDAGLLKSIIRKYPDVKSTMRGVLARERERIGAGEHKVFWVVMGQAKLIVDENPDGLYTGADAGPIQNGDYIVRIPFHNTYWRPNLKNEFHVRVERMFKELRNFAADDDLDYSEDVIDHNLHDLFG